MGVKMGDKVGTDHGVGTVVGFEHFRRDGSCYILSTPFSEDPGRVVVWLANPNWWGDYYVQAKELHEV